MLSFADWEIPTQNWTWTSIINSAATKIEQFKTGSGNRQFDRQSYGLKLTISNIIAYLVWAADKNSEFFHQVHWNVFYIKRIKRFTIKDRYSVNTWENAGKLIWEAEFQKARWWKENDGKGLIRKKRLNCSTRRHLKTILRVAGQSSPTFLSPDDLEVEHLIGTKKITF